MINDVNFGPNKFPTDHKERMKAKREFYRNVTVPGVLQLDEPLANLSRNHPDYGLTPKEHYRRKAEK